MKRSALFVLLLLVIVTPVAGQSWTKAQVGDLIKTVEDRTDDFKEYLEDKGDEARSRAAGGESSSRRGRRAEPDPERRAETKDDLEEAVEDLEKATDRLRRRFRRVDNYVDTRAQVDNVVDEAREINKIVAGGRYAAEMSKAWAALRVSINDLARVFGITPLAL